jgi:hypothetical protein
VTNRELLEAAAKAAGIWVGDDTFADPIDRKYSDALGLWVHVGDLEDVGHWWNPRNNGDHALSLAAKLSIGVEWWESMPQGISGRVNFDGNGVILMENVNDKALMLRKAIVRAAAAMAG